MAFHAKLDAVRAGIRHDPGSVHKMPAKSALPPADRRPSQGEIACSCAREAMRVCWRERRSEGSRSWRFLVDATPDGLDARWVDRSTGRRFERVEPRGGWLARAGILSPVSAFTGVEPHIPEPGEMLDLIPEPCPEHRARVRSLQRALNDCIASDAARAGVAAWARGECAEDVGYGHPARYWQAVHWLTQVALQAVDAGRQREDGRTDGGQWFLSQEDLQRWQQFLAGGLDEHDIGGGWRRTPLEGGMLGSNITTTWFRYNRLDLLELLGEPFRFFDGFCHGEHWDLRAPSGREYLIHRCTETTLELFEVTSATVAGETWGGHDALRELAEILDLHRLPQGTSEEGSPTVPRRWRVMRLDDNDTELEVSRHCGKAVAERVASQFEARGHKQTYWTEPLPGLTPAELSEKHLDKADLEDDRQKTV
mgnify:CR=1 FL=1